MRQKNVLGINCHCKYFSIVSLDILLIAVISKTDMLILPKLTETKSGIEYTVSINSKLVVMEQK